MILTSADPTQGYPRPRNRWTSSDSDATLESTNVLGTTDVRGPFQLSAGATLDFDSGVGPKPNVVWIVTLPARGWAPDVPLSKSTMGGFFDRCTACIVNSRP